HKDKILDWRPRMINHTIDIGYISFNNINKQLFGFNFLNRIFKISYLNAIFEKIEI
ncbi:hypothetical protein LCGC14_2417780, partial [marine sediment metagenome]